MNLKRTLKRLTNNEYAFSIIAKMFGVFAGLAYSIIYSRYFKPSLVGNASVIQSYSELIMLIACFGMYQGYPYFRKNSEQSIYKDYINMISGVFLLYSGISVAVICLIRPSLEVCAIAVLIPLMFATKELNYVVLIENSKVRNKSSMRLLVLDILILLVLLILFDANYYLCVGYLIIKKVVETVSAFIRLRINFFSIRPTLKGTWQYIRFGFVPMLTVIMMEVNYKADVIMLERFAVHDAQIGIYSLGVSLAQRVWLIPDALKDILLSKLAKGKSEEEVCKITRISMVAVLVCIIGLVALGKPFIDILYGNDYSDSYVVLCILLTGITGMVFYKMIYAYNVINGRKTINLILLSISAFINIIINAIVIPKMGIIGAALSSTVSYLACGIGFLYLFCKQSNISPSKLLFVSREDFTLIKGLFKGE